MISDTFQEWISVADEYPSEPGIYLCHFTDGTIETFPFDEDLCERSIYGENVIWGVHQDLVTHWMPLPEAPNGD